MFKCCPKCENNTFDTTKTVNLELMVTIQDGKMIEHIDASEVQDSMEDSFFIFVCKHCGENISYSDMFKKD